MINFDEISFDGELKKVEIAMERYAKNCNVFIFHCTTFLGINSRTPRNFEVKLQIQNVMEGVDSTQDIPMDFADIYQHDPQAALECGHRSALHLIAGAINHEFAALRSVFVTHTFEFEGE